MSCIIIGSVVTAALPTEVCCSLSSYFSSSVQTSKSLGSISAKIDNETVLGALGGCFWPGKIHSEKLCLISARSLDLWSGTADLRSPMSIQQEIRPDLAREWFFLKDNST